MISFRITHRSKKSRARVGILKTPHGSIETPSLIPVATQAVIKTLTSNDVERTKTQGIIANTFHLHLKPGEQVVKAGGGLHTYMALKKPIFTDSAGFQVFSLGFGRDLSVGKIAKTGEASHVVTLNAQPQSVKITETGVHFRSPVDGRRLFIGPRESIRIQEALGADIIFTFDECTPPSADKAYTMKSLGRTHRWAEQCIRFKKSKQALFGMVQGGRFKELRIASAKYVGSLPFAGFGIGGEFGDDKSIMTRMIRWVINELPDEKPRHLLGIGYLEDMPKIIREGVDTFDCIVPTHFARHGVAFIPQGRLDMRKTVLLKDKKPLDSRCACETCTTYSRSYIAHLFRAKEITAMRLLTFHNLYYFNTVVERIREGIKKGKV
ncbi:MAG: tRNA guanosine(34) transglycosylase Tgt [Patescibacteria group bacterium]|jgi:queuine tRNA-ribosyltransferase/7-cyano-7-deazaguanine tRNA-ribosyltransferase